MDRIPHKNCPGLDPVLKPGLGDCLMLGDPEALLDKAVSLCSIPSHVISWDSTKI